MLWLSATDRYSSSGKWKRSGLSEPGHWPTQRGFQDQQGVTNPSVAAPTKGLSAHKLTPTPGSCFHEHIEPLAAS